MRRSLILLLLVLAACSNEAIRDENDIETGDTLYSIDFDAENADFETGDFSNAEGSRAFDANLAIENGVYRIQYTASSSAYIWGQGGETAQNVEIEVEAKPLTDNEKHVYGVMCRVDENGAGYVFLISSDGYGGIAHTNGISLSFIAKWREHDAVKEGNASNKIRTVCVDDYFALYVNGKFVADAEDNTYADEGQVGFAAGILTATRVETEITVEFDNLAVHEAALAD